LGDGGIFAAAAVDVGTDESRVAPRSPKRPHARDPTTRGACAARRRRHAHPRRAHDRPGLRRHPSRWRNPNGGDLRRIRRAVFGAGSASQERNAARLAHHRLARSDLRGRRRRAPDLGSFVPGRLRRRSRLQRRDDRRWEIRRGPRHGRRGAVLQTRSRSAAGTRGQRHRCALRPHARRARAGGVAEFRPREARSPDRSPGCS